MPIDKYSRIKNYFQVTTPFTKNNGIQTLLSNSTITTHLITEISKYCPVKEVEIIRTPRCKPQKEDIFRQEDHRENFDKHISGKDVWILAVLCLKTLFNLSWNTEHYNFYWHWNRGGMVPFSSPSFHPYLLTNSSYIRAETWDGSGWICTYTAVYDGDIAILCSGLASTISLQSS